MPSARRALLAFVDRMKLLLDDLVNFVRLEQHAIDAHPVDLNRVMAQVRDDLALAISRAAARVECDALPVVAGNASQLRLVTQNLVANGIKFAGKGEAPIVRVFAQMVADRRQRILQRLSRDHDQARRCAGDHPRLHHQTADCERTQGPARKPVLRSVVRHAANRA